MEDLVRFNNILNTKAFRDKFLKLVQCASSAFLLFPLPSHHGALGGFCFSFVALNCILSNDQIVRAQWPSFDLSFLNQVLGQSRPRLSRPWLERS